LLDSALIARLQVEGVTLHFFDDVLGLNFALESTKSILHRFALLQSNFCHVHHPPNEHELDKLEITPFLLLSVDHREEWWKDPIVLRLLKELQRGFD
jgi:hypothetical protein